MTKVTLKLFACLLIFPILSCAQVFDVPLDYSYSKPTTLEFFPQSEKTVTVNDIKDKRNLENPRIIYHLKEDAYQAEKPVSEIIRDALIDAVKMSELNYSEKGGNILIDGELLAIDYKYTQGSSGFWQDQILHMTITVNLTIKDEDTGAILLQDDTYIGKSKVNNIGTSIESQRQEVKEAFIAALDNLIENIFNDEIFLEQMRKGLVKN